MKKQQNTRESSKNSTEYYPVSDSFKKKFFIRQTLFIIHHALRVALSIVLISQITSTDIQPFQNVTEYKRMQQVSQLWSKDVIVDIITVSTYNCPEGYEIFTSAIWPGTRQGCYCSTKLGIYDYFHVLPGYCNGKLIDAGCKQIQPQPPIPFVFWNSHSLICVKKIQNLTFTADLSNIPQLQKRKCGYGHNYQFESLSNVSCPISNLLNNTQLSNIIPYINFSYDRQNNYPIIDLKVTEYNFCPQYDKSNISPGRFQNYALQIAEIQYCEGSDPRVQEIDQITEQQAFLFNQRVHDVVQQLPGFPQPSNQFIYKLGITRYPPWKHECRVSTQFSLTKTITNFSLSQSTYSSQVTITLIIISAVIYGIIYSIFCCIQNIISIHYKHQSRILFLNDQQIAQINPNLLSNNIQLSLSGQILIFIVIMLCALITSIIIGVQYQKIYILEKWFRNSLQCTENTQYFVKYIDQYTNYLQYAIRKLLICILISVVMAAIDIVYFIWRYNKGDLATQNFLDIFKDMGEQQKNSDEQKMGKQLDKMQQQQACTQNGGQPLNNLRKGTLVTQQSLMNLSQNNEQPIADEMMVGSVSPVQRSRKLRKKKTFKTVDLDF